MVEGALDGMGRDVLGFLVPDKLYGWRQMSVHPVSQILFHREAASELPRYLRKMKTPRLIQVY